MENLKPRKVFVLLVPESGHVNPVTGIASELCKRNVQVTFYSTPKFKSLIERSGSIFKEYSHPWELNHQQKTIKEMTNEVVHLTSKLLDFTDGVLLSLVADIDREKPDVILYDMLSLFAQFLYKYLVKRHENDPSSQPPPKFIKISPSFASKPGVYPNEEEIKVYSKTNNMWYNYYAFFLQLKQMKLNWKYGFDVVNPIAFFQGSHINTITLTTLFPEFQPRVEQFDSSYKFIGCCVSESTRNYALNDPELEKILGMFQPINPVKDVATTRSQRHKLIYVSLGTVFNFNVFLFEKIIEAIEIIENQVKSSFDIKAVISVGENVYKQFQEKMSTTGYKFSENIIMRPFVPQIELIKRASLYITHCGMNSTIESIHYGVPCVCIPLMVDQPLVAARMVELNLAKMFDPLTVKAQELSEAINHILNDESYLSRVLEYSKFSRRLDGNVNGAVEILRYLGDSE